MPLMRLAAFVVLLVAIVPCAVRAQDARLGVGPKVGFYAGDGFPLFGLTADIPVTQRSFLEPAGEILTGTRKSTVIIADLNGRYYFGRAGAATGVFLLGGFGLHIDVPDVGSTEVGFRVNTGVGYAFDPISFLQPWIGLKIYLLDQKGSDVSLQGGALIRF